MCRFDTVHTLHMSYVFRNSSVDSEFLRSQILLSWDCSRRSTETQAVLTTTHQLQAPHQTIVGATHEYPQTGGEAFGALYIAVAVARMDVAREDRVREVIFRRLLKYRRLGACLPARCAFVSSTSSLSFPVPMQCTFFPCSLTFGASYQVL